MCNPRRVHVTSARELREDWQHRVTESVSATGRVVRAATVQHDVSGFGGPVLAELPAVLATAPGWRAAGACFEYRLGEDAHAVYDPAAQRLVVIAEESRDLTVYHTVEETISGTTLGEVSATGEGWYYDDEWGGRTEAKAREGAEAQAERDFAEKGRQKVEQDKAAAAANLQGAMRQKGQEEAAAAHARESELVGDELERAARRRVRILNQRAINALNRAGGLAARAVLVRFASENGARVDVDEEDDTVVRLEFTMER